MDISTLFETTPTRVAQGVGAAVRQRRVALGLTRNVLADRAGISVDLIKRLETTGQVGFESVVRVAIALGSADGILALFPPPKATSLDELERLADRRTRRNGVRRDAGRPRGDAASSQVPARPPRPGTR